MPITKDKQRSTFFSVKYKVGAYIMYEDGGFGDGQIGLGRFFDLIIRGPYLGPPLFLQYSVIIGCYCNETAYLTWSIMLKHLWSERDGERKSKEGQC